MPRAFRLLACLALTGGAPVAIAAAAPAPISPPPQTAGVSYDDVAPEIEYSTGQWTRTAQLPMAHAGTLTLTDVPGAAATLRFSGTHVGFAFRMSPDAGIVSMTVDGIDQGAIDLYSAHHAWQVTKWLTVPAGEHTLTIRHTGLKHRASAGTSVAVDRFIVGVAPAGRGLYDDGDPRSVFGGVWDEAGAPDAYNGGFRQAKGLAGTEPGAPFFSFTFVGDRVSYIGGRGQNRGKAAIVIDGVRRGVIDLYAGTIGWQVPTTFDLLGSGVHELHVTVLSERNPSSTDYLADMDAVLVGLDPRCGSQPSVIYTYVPLLGTTDNLEGRLCHIDPSAHATVTYIRVGGGYWVKPTAAQPVTFPSPDTGTFVTDITTGGSDVTATELVTYAIPASFTPPILLGSPTIPSSLETAAIAKVVVTRQTPPPPYRGPVLGPVVSSSFTSNLEGWSNPSIRLSSAGNPPASLEFQEVYAAGDAFMLAPPKYLGSFSHFSDAARISFEHRVLLTFGTAYWGTPVNREVRLSGPGGSATWIGPVPAFSADWVPVIVPLDPGQWTQTSGTWGELLEQVTEIQIRVDHFNDLFGVEQTQFDNIRMSAGYTAVPPFTDDPLQARTTAIRAVHITELRARVDALRQRFGLERFPWTNSSLAGVLVRAVHLTELRVALGQVYDEAGRMHPVYTDPILGSGAAIKAAHVQDLRAAIAAIP